VTGLEDQLKILPVPDQDKMGTDTTRSRISAVRRDLYPAMLILKVTGGACHTVVASCSLVQYSADNVTAA
jgi:hypothetical protein